MTIYDIMDYYLDSLLNSRLPDSRNLASHPTTSYPSTASYSVPTISRVHFNGNKTIVWFVDGSKCIVECSVSDNYDRKTAIAYAIVKRMFGKVGAKDANDKWDPRLVDGNGFGQILQKFVDNGFDQVKANQELANQKREAKARHEAKQRAEHEAAFERRAQKLAEELRLKKRAEEILASDSLTKTRQILNESSCKNLKQEYKRPNKRFRDFTAEERREYWRNQNAKRNNKR